MSVTHRVALEPLIAGQRLDREEFHERYAAMPPGTRAELIGGVTVMPSPVGDRHGVTSANAVTWLNVYRFSTPGAAVGDNTSTALDDLGESQPDAFLRLLPEVGGQTRTLGKIVAGAPELVVEVADRSRSIDLGDKLRDYERAGTLEYVVFALDPDEVFWFARRDGKLVRISPDPDGIYRSEAFPGLWLDPLALLNDDGSGLLRVLSLGLAAPEHSRFVAKLASHRL
jgi:Uma2 family endonuclease